MSRAPKWPFRILRMFCPPELYEEISGDLAQRFERDASKSGIGKAKGRLVWNTLRFFRPGILLRNRLSTRFNQNSMIRHFLKIFGRVTLKEKTYSVLNIGGLAIGLAASSIILLWIVDELNFDSINKDKDRIFQVVVHHNFPDGMQTDDSTPGPLAPAMSELPEVESSARVILFGVRLLFNRGDKTFYEEGVYADPSVVDVLTIPIKQGVARMPIGAKDQMMIGERMARKYFGDEDPLGKTIRFNNERDMTIAAVFYDLPSNSTFKPEYILPYSLYIDQDQYNNEWGAWTGGQTMVKLRDPAHKAAVEAKIHEAHTKPKIWVRWDNNVTLDLFSMNDWRLKANFVNGVQSGGKIRYVIALGAVAAFILIIACANFVNLATARSVGRSKEVGVRKVIGAVKASLVRQFMMESVLMAFIAMAIGLVLIHLSLPYFNDLTSKQLSIDYTNPAVVGSIVGIALLTGLVAGSYPSFFLSSIGAINALKGNALNLTGAGIRKSLVVVQFALSTLLIAAALVLYQQIEYMRDKDLGFDHEHVFYLDYFYDLNEHFDVYRQSALNSPAIANVSRAGSPPMPLFGGMVLSDNAWPGKTQAEDILFEYLRCDDQLVPLLGLEIVEGRNFSTVRTGDAEPEYIVSEEAVRNMKLKDPVGTPLIAPVKGQIVGVVKDFNTQRLREPVQSLIMANTPPKNGVMMVSYKPGQLPEAVSAIEALHRQYSPGRPVEITFMDDAFNKIYEQEILTGKLAGSFTMIAIVISCLGLFGLVSFSAERRKKEIGIRKVLGADVIEVVVLLCRDFAVLIGVALAIGLPIAGWMAARFLSEFAFHVDIGISLYIWTILSMFGLALAAVSFQSIRAAVAKPVDSLRTE